MREFTVIIILPLDSLTLFTFEKPTTLPQEERVTLQNEFKAGSNR